jgi:hypothetical protein
MCIDTKNHDKMFYELNICIYHFSISIPEITQIKKYFSLKFTLINIAFPEVIYEFYIIFLTFSVSVF